MPTHRHHRIGPDRPRLGHGVRARRLGRAACTTRSTASPTRRSGLIADGPRRARRATVSWTDPDGPAARVRRGQERRRRARWRELRAGERARSRSRPSARSSPSSMRCAAPRRDPRLVHVGDRRAACSPRSLAGPRALPRRASGQPAAPGADRRALRRAVDRAGDHRARASRSTRASARCRSSCAARSTASSSTACRARCWRRRSGWSARAMCRRRTSTRPSTTGSACAGRSWGRSRPSS